jgi:hypothetical protein
VSSTSGRNDIYFDYALGEGQLAGDWRSSTKSRRYRLSAEYRRFIEGRIATMQKTKMTVRVPRELLENVKRFTAEHNTTLTGLIVAYLRRIPAR